MALAESPVSPSAPEMIMLPKNVLWREWVRTPVMAPAANSDIKNLTRLGCFSLPHAGSSPWSCVPCPPSSPCPGSSPSPPPSLLPVRWPDSCPGAGMLSVLQVILICNARRANCTPYLGKESIKIKNNSLPSCHLHHGDHLLLNA